MDFPKRYYCCPIKKNRSVFPLKPVAILFALILLSACTNNKEVRKIISLNTGWKSIAMDSLSESDGIYSISDFDDSEWKSVDIPHNWDDYYGYRRLRHGNLHGVAWYRRELTINKESENSRYFLWFEGVGSYATVWMNGMKVGYHAGGRTSFTVDITDAISFNGENVLLVRADHPPNIRDLPWVCGGCSPEWGFSEGSQPFGIFRPVHLVVTAPIRIEPFGVHVWNDVGAGKVSVNTHIRNYSQVHETVCLVSRIEDKQGKIVSRKETKTEIRPGETITIQQHFTDIRQPHLWSPEDPYLYKLVSQIHQNKVNVDRTVTQFGIRWIHWDIDGDSATNRFYLNGKPYFINGTAEYEHLLGQSHAFSEKQVEARVEQIKSAGFNAFRDAHQPHNLRYQHFWDSLGILWWPQMAAHIWFDNPAFRENFKKLLSDWIIERRNSPSIILWGLENESTLPEDFARECADLIRQLDPTASIQRKITTCNGGTGTDWNVIQNWSGTYGGDPALYGDELIKHALNGEYGAWRSIGLHTEGEFVQDGPLSEERFCLLMESKIRLSDSVSSQCCGHFHWLFASHENPGRIQGGEGIRDIDRLGPVNYKGLFTIWGEPTDGYYLYRSNYAPKEHDPMVYIVSHTWEDRWINSGIKNGIRVFSNCDEVELFNGSASLGKKNNPGRGSHYTWDSVEINNNILHAVGYVNKRKAAEDCIVLNHQDTAINIADFAGNDISVPKEIKGHHYLYRVNCGGPDYTDRYGHKWMADLPYDGTKSWGSVSWTGDFRDLPSNYGSQRYTRDPIKGTLDWPLFQTFRYGRHRLKYHFPLPDGDYLVELFFIEPWYGTGGGIDCEGWRVFNVAFNGKNVINDLDIWRETGHDHVLKKTIRTTIDSGYLEISFPEVLSGQAVISAIAISTKDKKILPVPRSTGLIKELLSKNGEIKGQWTIQYWLSTGIRNYSDERSAFFHLPPELHGAEWIRTPCSKANLLFGTSVAIVPDEDVDLFIGIPGNHPGPYSWMDGFIRTGEVLGTTLDGKCFYTIFRKRCPGSDTIELGPFTVPDRKDDRMPVIAFQPATNLDAPIDLRESVTYQAEDARYSNSSKVLIKAGKPSVWIRGKEGYINWKITVGIAAKYGLEFRYMNPQNHSVFATVDITTDNDIPVYQGVIEFLPSGDRWKSIRTDTHSSINAGDFRIILNAGGSDELLFDWLKVQ